MGMMVCGTGVDIIWDPSKEQKTVRSQPATIHSVNSFITLIGILATYDVNSYITSEYDFTSLVWL